MSAILDKTENLMNGAVAMLGSVAAHRYDDAQHALEGVMDRGKDIYGSVREQAIRQTKFANKLLHGHLYNTVLIGIALGAVLGFLAAKRCAHRAE